MVQQTRTLSTFLSLKSHLYRVSWTRRSAYTHATTEFELIEATTCLINSIISPSLFLRSKRKKILTKHSRKREKIGESLLFEARMMKFFYLKRCWYTWSRSQKASSVQFESRRVFTSEQTQSARGDAARTRYHPFSIQFILVTITATGFHWSLPWLSRTSVSTRLPWRVIIVVSSVGHGAT